jgi:hypothetical protein
MLYWTLVGLNVGIAIANGFMLVRCWRTMRKVDQMQAETTEILSRALALKARFKKLNPDYADPTD